MSVQHPELAAGRWQKFSLAEQLGNIGSEIGRARIWKEKDIGLSDKALVRAFELIDLTLADQRWRLRMKELTRLREVVADASEGGAAYRSSLENIERYLSSFAIAARVNRKV